MPSLKQTRKIAIELQKLKTNTRATDQRTKDDLHIRIGENHDGSGMTKYVINRDGTYFALGHK